MADAKRDNNYVTTLIAVSNVDGTTPVTLYADPITHRLLVSASAFGGATTALDNLASVAINTSLISDTDITDDLGSMAIRWNDVFAQTLSTGDTATDTVKLRGYDVDGTAYVDFLTITAADDPTCTISNITSSTAFNPTVSDGSALGTTSLMWSDLFLALGAVINFNDGDITLTHSANTLTLGGGNLALGANNLTMTGSLGETGSRLTKGWFTDLEVTNAIAGSITGNAATVTNATFTTALTVDTGTVTLTGNVANSSVLTIGAGAVSVSGSNTGDQDLSGLVTKATFDAHSILYATADDTPLALTVTEQTLVGRLTGGNISAIAIGIADNNIVQIDQDGVADNDFAKFTANGLEGRSYTEVKADLDLEIGTDIPALTHAAQHAVGGTDTIFPADPGSDKYLMWDDDPGQLVWADAGAGGGATTALDNLASVAINTSLISDTDNTDALGSAAISWSDLFLGSGSVITWSTAPSEADITLTHSANLLTLAGGDLAISNLTASEILITDADKKIVSAPVATYPSLTELSYVKGLSSAVQTQMDGKLALAGGTMTGDIQLGETDIKLDAALSGDEKWSGIVIAGTAGATLAVGDLCYLDPTDSRWELADANVITAADGDCRGSLGICVLAGNDGGATEMLVWGKVRSAAFPAFTVNNQLFVSETAGDITHTAPTTADSASRVVGVALTAEDLFFNPSPIYWTHT